MNGFVFITLDEAMILLGTLSAIAVPFIVSFLKQSTWPEWVKWGCSAVVSLVLGYLTLVATGALEGVSSVIIFSSLILNVASGIYHSVFKNSGIERKLNPDG